MTAVGYHGHSGGAAADHDDLLARVVQILGPLLRVHDLPTEAVPALELGGESPVVPVVTTGHENPVGTELHQLFGLGVLDVDRPAGIGTRPGRAEHLVVEPHLFVDAVLGGRLPEVAQDLVGAGDGVFVTPRLELVAEGVQIGVRADARVAEQVPGAAAGAARLQDGVGPARVLLLQVVGGADAGQTGTDDQDIHLLHMAGGALHC